MHGVRENDVLQTLKTIRGSSRVTDQTPEGKYEALERYVEIMGLMGEESETVSRCPAPRSGLRAGTTPGAASSWPAASCAAGIPAH